jgi:hypothetical protein
MRRGLRLAPELSVALAGAALAMGALFAVGIGGWPGAPNGCVARDTCFCEAFRPGLVRQPANTWSNLGFVAVGLAMGALRWRERRHGLPPRRANPMTTRALEPGLYALLTVLLGPGSMALHASMTHWGGRVDVASMYLWAAFPIAYGASRAFELSRRSFLALYGALSLALVAALWAPPGTTEPVFALLLAGVVAAQLTARRLRPELSWQPRWLVASGLLFGAGFALWVPSRQSTGALCHPDSWLQGHAAWHLLCACAAAAIWAYFRSEQPRKRLHPGVG